MTRFDLGYRELLTQLGIGSLEERRRRGAEIEAFLPRLWQVADAIIASR
jgi:hypothetical protein